MSTPKLVLMCTLSVILLPVTVLLAIASACGGDRLMLQVLRGKTPVDEDTPL